MVSRKDTNIRLSLVQRTTLEQIRDITEEFGKDRWFTQGELYGATVRTMKALVKHGFIEEMKSKMGYLYYKLKEI